MAYKMDVESTGTDECTLFPGKEEYSIVRIGGSTKISQIYIDLTSGIEDQPNKLHEGGVRPPR